MDEKLEKIKNEYQNMSANINNVVFPLDRQGYSIYRSPAVTRMISCKQEERIGQLLAGFVHPQDLNHFQDNWQRLLEGELDSFEFRLLDKRNNIRHIHIISRRLSKTGQLANQTGILGDVTTQDRRQALLLQPAKKYRHIFENSVEGIFRRTFEGRFITANPACARILGYSSPGELMASNPNPEKPLYGSRERQAEFQRLLQELGVVQGFEYEVYRQDGHKIWISESAQGVRDAKGAVLFYEGTIRDITERKMVEEQIKFLSFHDRLTGLYNRAFFEEEMKRLNTPRQLPLSIIMGDVNSLKLVNDGFGHSEGDKLLARVAAILKECCRKEDVIARLGGDEFAIFLPRTNRRVTLEIIQRIKTACQNLGQDITPVSISLGAATKEEISQDIHGIIKEAEDQMYREKLLESKNHKATILSSLRHALFEKSHETEEHTLRLQRLAMHIGRAFGLPGETLEELALLADLHDIGKIALPQEIIFKPGNLSATEWEVIRKHSEIGYRIAISSPELTSIADAILAHHEWWNGAGYPRGLKGEKIPLLARIFSIVDAYEVLTCGRPYKKPLPHERALDELKKGAGSQFDPRFVEIFLELFVKTCMKKRENP